MTEQAPIPSEVPVYQVEVDAANLLHHYAFELGGASAEPLVATWLEQYPPQWVRWAIIEALYQGRYKAISVEQILSSWQRRGQPLYHFNLEFERLCQNFPQRLAQAQKSAQRSAKVLNLPTGNGRSRQFFSTMQDLVSAQTTLTPAMQRSGAKTIPFPYLRQPSSVTDPPAVEPSGKTIIQEIAAIVDGLPAAEAASNPALLPTAEAPGAQPEAVVTSPHPPAIDQFMPESKSSDFYSRLKAVAESSTSEPPLSDEEKNAS